MELPHPLPSDGQLVDATRRGSVAAWAEVESRHGKAVTAVARARRVHSPRRAAEQALDRVRRSLVEGEQVADGVSAVRALRPLAIAELTGGAYGPVAADGDPETAVEGDDVLALAFARLPEPWQTVLWHGVVEGRAPSEMTPYLGRGVNDVIALQHLARSGLHQSYLRALADADGPSMAEECRPVVPLLAAAGRGTLAARDQRLVDNHLAIGREGAPCRDCQARLDLAGTIDGGLPPAVVPGITGLPVERYRAAIGSEGRAFGAASLRATRSERVRRLAVVAAAAAVVIAVLGAFRLIQIPFDASISSSSWVPSTVPATAEPPPGTTDTTAPPPSSTEPPSPTTTELLLRPPPTGPANGIELLFAPGTRPTGVAAPEIEIAVTLDVPGVVFAGGTGTVDVGIANLGATATEANFEVRTEKGLLFDALVDGPAECRGPADDAAFCNITVAPGSTETVTLRFRLESSIVGRLVVDPGAVGERIEVPIEATPRLVHSSVGRGDIVTIGNTVISCVDSAPACSGARDLSGAIVNRWDVPMEFIGAAPAFGLRNSSEANLDLAPGTTIEAAYLFWSGDLDERGQFVSGDEARRVTLFAPDANPVVVEAERLILGDIDATQYLGVADVTGLMRGAGGYLVGDVQSVEVQGSYAGWSLVVVTADASLPRRQFIVTSPFAWFAPEYEYRSVLPVPFGRAEPATLDLLAFEGEPGFLPEQLTAGGVALGGDNEFDGSITGPRDPSFVNSFGIDIETYALTIDAPDGTLSFDATSGKDGVRLAVFGLAVDLPS